ncbi:MULTISPECIES: MARTX multifunctional-autoprocessing repeats-in-toxin holotoxin RtxA [unclassified Vibrio]|nr:MULTISPECIES: MARTX multifunctional-autoprocessing repeats-in-toxin holotoxin RtxA [unclassified Vibrio]NAX42323.1 MARTX multifunctional-autoprocessing repeats-in-toxin holotoxin RtxA [Vibrio sp. V25_P4S6T154]OXX42658.1 RTX toxin RtxA [Vibrio sp. V17_P4S1T151]OXX59654.1 RTX toxin RtxA [Vibrio sp. V15_P4S5T153]OXX68000.1 RTX toxin RtxA [Vibrio sp. V20_P4S3T152]
MGKPFWRSVEYFFTGNYSADDGNNDIVAIGFGGEIHAYGGDDHIHLGSIGATVYTGSGNDTVSAGAGYLKVEDTTGNLSVRGAAGYADIKKNGDGNLSFSGAAGGVDIGHDGQHGNISYAGAAAYNHIKRQGLSGHVSFQGAGGYNAIWHETNHGNLNFEGAGAGNKIDRTWFNQYQGSQGDVRFVGAGVANSISSRVESGNLHFSGAGADNHLVRKGKVGDITLEGAGASNRIERTHNANDVYTETRGNIRFEGVGGYNSLYSDVAHGDIHFSGGGAYNTITRKGSGGDFDAQGMEYAKAEEIVLTTAQMHGISIDNGNKFHAVNAVKSEREPNTYLFAIADGTYTKINKIRLYNDAESGKLKYYSEAWFKQGNHLTDLAHSDVSSSGGFESNPVNGGYTLSNIAIEHQQSVTVHAVEKSLTEYEWVTYANGAVIDAKDVSLSDAKMGGHAIYADGTKVDVKAVKSNRKPNTYVYAKVLGPYTKIVVVELANDAETGALKYQARSWYKEGDHTANIANQDISSATGYNPMGKGGYSLSDLHYSVNAVRSTSETVADIDEYTDQTLFKPVSDSGESSGDVHFNGVGGGNVIKSNVTRGHVYFNGGGLANVILHSSQFGNTEFNGAGAANVIVKSGEEGDLTFRGAGLANVLVHQSQQGKMDVYAGGALNVLVRVGNGDYLAHLLAYGNISVQKGQGNSRVTLLGGYNTHTQIGSGDALWLAAGGFNVMTQVGQGDVASVLAGGANVLTKMGDGELTAGMLGGANVITHISSDDQLSNTTAVALGGANILTKKGKGNTLAVMGGGANVLTHVGDGTTTGVMVGGANILTKVGNGDTTGIMLGVGNVLTHVGDGQTLGVMGAAGNIFTKVGDGTSISVMIGAGNIFTHVGEGNAWALMGGLGNVFTKVGNGDALALMVAEANVFTHIGDGMSVALMLAKGNIATKVGNGTTLAAMVGNANIFTHVGSGSTFAAMIGQANIMTKVGDDLTAALMVGKANIYTHVGDGTSLGIFAGEVNVMTKVGNSTTLAAMFGKANIMTHVGDGLTGVLALGEANIVTKVGDDFMGVVAAAKANVVTHVGDATTAAVLAGKGNILTKVGEGTTVGLLISDIGNVMTHVGDGTTIGIAKGKANIITKVGDGLGVNVAWGQANVFTQVGDGDRYNFAKGEANIISKVGDGQEVSAVQGQANIITHVGDGDDYTGAWGKANVITKVGNGRNVVLAKGEANIVTQVGDGDSFNALWSKGNIVTKVGDGMQVTAAKGKANVTTRVGDGLNVTAAYGDANINTVVGDGISVNVAWGQYNVNTKIGDGLNVAVMKGKANANIHVGDGLGVNASYAQNNVAIKIGNGDFYSLAVASSNTSSNKLSALFDNIKQTVLGVGGSQAINYLVQGDEASSSGTHKGRGAIATPEITKLDGFQMEAIEEVGSDLGDSLTGSVTKVDAPDLNPMQNALSVDDSSDQVQGPNLIVNGDFEQSDFGWSSTHGVEAYVSASSYGLERDGHGNNVSELATDQSTTIYQDIQNLTEGEVIAVSFDFAKRAGISNNEGIDVLWNGEVVFSSSGDESAWQKKTLKLTAQAGSNRIEFKGTGHDDGLGYILDNVVAKLETLQQTNAVSEHATQNQASQNALSDKERAEADRQRLEQEKQKQLDAVAGSQSQLESTDQQALGNNGQAQRDAVQEESEAITAELTKLAQGLDVLDSQATHTGESGDQWRNNFAGGLLDGVQSQLDDAKQLANDKIAAAKQTQSDNNSKVKESVAKSEAGVAKGEQNLAGAEQDIADAKIDAEKRKADALAKGNNAKQAESDAHSAANDAQSRGDRDAMNAEHKANQVQNDAKGAKQNESDRPDRQGVAGSGLVGQAHSVEAAGAAGRHINADSQTNADGRFSEGLSEQELEALEGATNAVNRLQINAGIRAKNTGSSVTSMFTETNADSIVVPTTAPQDLARKEIRISGVNLEGLGEASSDIALGGNAIDNMLRESLPFYSLRTERNLLVQEGEEGFEVRSWPGTDGKSKTILLDNPEDAAQQKAIERFILANFDNFEQMPDELFLVDNKVISHHEGRTRVLAQKEEGAWKYNTKAELMSVTELLDAASVTGKIRGESYQQVIDALTEYHASTIEHADYELESVEKLLNLRKQVEGYLLGHPDSGRVEAMSSLLNQVNVRLEEVSVLAASEQSIKTHDSFSRLYDQLDNANLKESKHLYLDGNGDFVTKGKGNLANIDQLGGSDAVLDKVKVAVSHEYGQAVADTIFAGFSANDLAKDGKGIDIAGLNKVHQAIEQHMSPVSATMYIWKPSDHSTLGHAALQIGQGRTQLEGQAAADFNKQNYVSWWPLGSKSSNIRNIFNVATKNQPDLKLRWSDFSQPAHQNDTLEHDMVSEENDGFGLNDGETKLKRFIEKLNAAKGIDASYKDASEGYASVLLGNPDILETTGIPAHVFQPFVEQWNDTSYDMMDVANRFAEELQKQAQASGDPALVEKRIANVVRQFAERALEEIKAFKASEADQGRVFRINLEGLDTAAMQAEWHRLSNDPDARYQLLTKNCSSTVAKVLKAGGADKLIGHTWLPKFGVWTPTELFNFGQALQEAQLEIVAKKQSHQVSDVLDALSGNEKQKETVAIENDGTPPRDKESLSPLTRFLNNELYGDKEARRKIGEITQTLLDHAVEQGESQKVTLKGESGRLTGYYHQGAASSEGETSATSGKVVLFLHGSGSSAEEQASEIRNHYQKQGIDMLAVNLRGYGESDGGPSEKGLYQDARTMFNYLVNDKGIDPSNIIIHGYSMGGPIAADLARYAAQNGQAVSGLLLDRPMPSMTKAITAHEVANPAGIVGAIAKAVNGQFSVEKNLKGLPKETPILLLTDNEGLGEEGEKLRAKLAIAGYNVTGEQTFYGHEASNRLMGQYADQIVSGLFNAEQAAVEAGEVLKGLEKDFKRYGDALKPDTSVPGKSKDIRTTKDFLNGYKNDHAKEIVDGFRSDMSIKQLVDLFVKGNWSAEQKGALAWEIESRALKVTFQNKSEKYNRLFREIASAGVVDAKATEQLAPQLMLLNLSNDGFGGRCDPLSKLVLVAKQLENDGQVGVARQLLEKMYSAAAVLSNPTLYSDSEKANASKLLSSLAAIHAKNPMHDTSMKVWQEKLEGKQALTLNGVVEKITDASANGKPVLLELDAPGHAMAAWAKGSGDDRVYGFYDPNAGIVEFSSAEKFGDYLTRFFGKSDLNMAQSYKLGKNDAGEAIFNRVVVMDGNTLASYKPTFGDKTTMQGILDLPVFDATPIKKPGALDVDGNAKAVDDTKEALAGGKILHNQNVNDWEHVVVTPTADGGESRFDGQIIVQMENDDVVAKAAANLAGKHPESSVVVQIDSDGNYRVVYGDPSKLDGKLRWQLVGHGRDDSESNNTRLSGYSADELAVKLAKFQQAFGQAENISNKPDHISIVGCSLVSDDKQKGFGHQFINAMDANGLRVDVSVRNSDVAVDTTGRKHTQDTNGNWVKKAANNKVSLTWNTQGEVTARDEVIRNGVAEGDIHLSRVGASEVNEPARGAIGDNSEVFEAPEKRKTETDTTASAGSDNKLSYSGNIQVNVGDGEFTAVNWGTSNVGIKVGTGGFKSLAFGDNNVMVHIGNGDSKHSVDIAGYQALEGAQMFMGNRNVSFNMGRSNDLIVMMDKSIPTPPLVNPFDGASRISGVLQSIAQSGKGADWLAAQEQQWTLSGAKKFVKEMSGLDQTSSVDYSSLVDLDSQNERSSRGLKSDAEATLNKKYNQWLSGNSNNDSGKMSRADKFRQMNEKLAFNFAVGGQGADIQVTTGNWNFMFGDNIQAILDTNLGSLFGVLTQQFSATGMAQTTFTYNPQDLPRQLKNKLLGKFAEVGAETTLGDIFGVNYTADGKIVSRTDEAVDGVAILKEMLEVIGEFGGEQLSAFTDPEKLLDSLKAGIDMGADGLQSFAESHGLKEKAPEENDTAQVTLNGAPAATENVSATVEETKPERAFGFNALNLPNLFATMFSKDKQAEMASLVSNLKQNLTADLLNMKDKTFDFLRNSGHLQGDGDMNVSLGNYNFNWGGDGKDLGAYLGDNNNFWGGRGDDVFYATGVSNIFTGGEGHDMGVLMGRENMMFGGDGNDTAVVAGRINHVFMGAGDDQSFVFGEGGEITMGSGNDYAVTSGNFNRVDMGDDQDFAVTIGNNNQLDLGAGNDFARVFGNHNRIDAGQGNDEVKLMGYHASINAGEGEDYLIAAAISKFSTLNGGEGKDVMVLGGYQNTFKGGAGVDSFVVSGEVIDNVVEDIRQGENIIFNGIDWNRLWFERSGYDLKISMTRHTDTSSDQTLFDALGCVTFNDYFANNRAKLIIGLGEKDAQGEQEYTCLTDNALDNLIQAMSSFAPKVGESNFMDGLASQPQQAIMAAWSDVNTGKFSLS